MAHVFFLRRGLLPPVARVVDTTGADDEEGVSASCWGSCSVGVTVAARSVPFNSDILFSGGVKKCTTVGSRESRSFLSQNTHNTRKPKQVLLQTTVGRPDGWGLAPSWPVGE